VKISLAVLILFSVFGLHASAIDRVTERPVAPVCVDTEYQLICDRDPQLLSSRITSMLSQGWHLYGNPTNMGSNWLCQGVSR
jgi:hypothetical protein